MTEWLKVADCKSVRFSYVGSNPTSFKTRKTKNTFLAETISLHVLIQRKKQKQISKTFNKNVYRR